MNVGDECMLMISRRYVEDGANYPGLTAQGYTVVAPESDRMQSSYTYYIFKTSEFQHHFGTSGDGQVTVRVTAVHGDETAATSAEGQAGAVPEGGFDNHWYHLDIIED